MLRGSSNFKCEESDQFVTLLMSSHTLGSNSTTTQGPSVVELITFAALSWSVMVLLLVIVAIFLCCVSGKQSVNDT